MGYALSPLRGLNNSANWNLYSTQPRQTSLPSPPGSGGEGAITQCKGKLRVSPIRGLEFVAMPKLRADARYYALSPRSRLGTC